MPFQKNYSPLYWRISKNYGNSKYNVCLFTGSIA